MTYDELIAKRDAEFFKAFAKDKNINRAEFNKKNPVKMPTGTNGFQNVPRDFEITPPTTELEKIYFVLSEYCKKFPDVKTPNIVLSGATGTGKTFMSQIIANNLMDRKIWVEYTTAFALIKEFQNYANSFWRDDAKINDFLSCDLLLIDDLGSEPIVKNLTHEHIYNTINERLSNGRPFIITTNLAPQALIEKYDQRIASRILSKQSSIVIPVNGKDLRLS